MKRFNIISFIIFSIASTGNSQQKASLIKFAELEKVISTQKNKIFIINFWATWCAPCIAEFADFQHFHQKNSDKNVELLLISLDFTSELEKVNNFIAKKGILPSVYLLNETDQNLFINKVSNIWEGTIPATWFINNKNGKKLLIEKPITELEINNYLAQIN